MKKRNLKNLALNKTSISSLKEITGGLRIPIDPIDSNCTSLGNGDPCPETHDCDPYK
ncbi:MAG: hypothetical protein AAF611_13920 [Bacteroidota bacterium]